MKMSRLPVPIVTLVTGEEAAGGALALAVGDRVLMMENSYYSVISPEGCSTILFKDAAQAPRAAEALRLTAADLLRLGIMDAVVPEPEGGAHTDAADRRRERQGARSSPRCASCSASPRDELLENRYERFRKFGAPRPADPSADRRERMTDSTNPDGSDPLRLGGSARPRQAARGLDRAALLGRGGRDEDRDRAEPPPAWPSRRRRLPRRRRRCPQPPRTATPSWTGGIRSSRRSSARSTAPAQPGAKPFVEEGDVVDEGQTVAIVEAMKLMNQVKADQGGTVAQILCTDGDWVEFEQPLIHLEPVDSRVFERS